MRTLRTLGLLVGLAAYSAAGIYYGTSINTTTGKATQNLSGVFKVAASSTTPTTYTIILDGELGLTIRVPVTLDGSSITVNGDALITGDQTVGGEVIVSGVSVGATLFQIGVDTASLRVDVDANAVAIAGISGSTVALQDLVDALGISTGTLRIDVDQNSVDIGDNQNILAQVGVSTASLQTQVDSNDVEIAQIGIDTASLQGQIDSNDVEIAQIGVDTATLQGDVDSRVLKAGDTMTGDLTLAGSSLTVQGKSRFEDDIYIDNNSLVSQGTNWNIRAGSMTIQSRLETWGNIGVGFNFGAAGAQEALSLDKGQGTGGGLSFDTAGSIQRIYPYNTDEMRIDLNGSARIHIDVLGLSGFNTSAGKVMNENASLINPSLVPDRSDLDTGIGANGSNTVALITAGQTRLYANANGRIGINTGTGVDEMLEVVEGNIKAEYGIIAATGTFSGGLDASSATVANNLRAGGTGSFGALYSTGSITSGDFFYGNASKMEGLGTSGEAFYLYVSTPADVGIEGSTYTYMVSQSVYEMSAKALIELSGLSTDPDDQTNVISRITEIGYPGAVTIPAGIINNHNHIWQSDGPGSIIVKSIEYIRHADGTEVAISTSNSATLGGVEADLNATGIVETTTTLATDRLVHKIWAYRIGGNANTEVSVSYDDQTFAGTAFPASAVDVGNFVPYSGATANVHLGVHSLTAPSIIGNLTGDVAGNAVGDVHTANGVAVSTVAFAPMAGATPASEEGMVYYDDDDDKLMLHNGAGWVPISTGTAGGGISSIEEDTDPKLGNKLDTNGFSINTQLTVEGSSLTVDGPSLLKGDVNLGVDLIVDGRIGIGIDPANYAFQMSKPSYFAGRAIDIYASADNQAIYTRYYDTDANADWMVGKNASDNFSILDDFANEPFVIQNETGFVGINETNPDSNLEIKSEGEGDKWALKISSANNGRMFFVENSGAVGIGGSDAYYPLDIRATYFQGGAFPNHRGMRIANSGTNGSLYGSSSGMGEWYFGIVPAQNHFGFTENGGASYQFLMNGDNLRAGFNDSTPNATLEVKSNETADDDYVLLISSQNGDTLFAVRQDGQTVGGGVGAQTAISGMLLYDQTTDTVINSVNVSSVTDVGPGIFRANWTTPMADANYYCTGMAHSISAGSSYFVNTCDYAGGECTGVLAGSASFEVSNQSATEVDVERISIICYGSGG